MNTVTLVLLVAFAFKHFLADFPLQTVYMLGKGKHGLSFILPLAAHCAVHAGLSLIIILWVNKEFAYLAGIEFIAHFWIDRLKCLYKLPQGQWAPEEKGKYLARYYSAFGLDQMAHQLTYILMVFFMNN